MASNAWREVWRRLSNFKVASSKVCMPMLTRLKGKVDSMSAYVGVRSSGLTSRVISSAS